MGSLTEWLFVIIILGIIGGIPTFLSRNPKTYEDTYKQEYISCLRVNQSTKEIPNLENYCSFYAASRMK